MRFHFIFGLVWNTFSQNDTTQNGKSNTQFRIRIFRTNEKPQKQKNTIYWGEVNVIIKPLDACHREYCTQGGVVVEADGSGVAAKMARDTEMRCACEWSCMCSCVNVSYLWYPNSQQNNSICSSYLWIESMHLHSHRFDFDCYYYYCWYWWHCQHRQHRHYSQPYSMCMPHYVWSFSMARNRNDCHCWAIDGHRWSCCCNDDAPYVYANHFLLWWTIVMMAVHHRRVLRVDRNPIDPCSTIALTFYDSVVLVCCCRPMVSINYFFFFCFIHMQVVGCVSRFDLFIYFTPHLCYNKNRFFFSFFSIFSMMTFRCNFVSC